MEQKTVDTIGFGMIAAAAASVVAAFAAPVAVATTAAAFAALVGVAVPGGVSLEKACLLIVTDWKNCFESSVQKDCWIQWAKAAKAELLDDYLRMGYYHQAARSFVAVV